MKCKVAESRSDVLSGGHMARKSQNRAPPHPFGLSRMQALLGGACMKQAGRRAWDAQRFGGRLRRAEQICGEHRLLLTSLSAGGLSRPPHVSSEHVCDDYLRDRWERVLGAELGQINCNYFKVLSTFNDWQGFGLCHQIFKYRYVFFLQLGT